MSAALLANAVTEAAAGAPAIKRLRVASPLFDGAASPLRATAMTPHEPRPECLSHDADPASEAVAHSRESTEPGAVPLAGRDRHLREAPEAPRRTARAAIPNAP